MMWIEVLGAAIMVILVLCLLLIATLPFWEGWFYSKFCAPEWYRGYDRLEKGLKKRERERKK